VREAKSVASDSRATRTATDVAILRSSEV